MDCVQFTYTEILRNSILSPQSSIEEICGEVRKHQEGCHKKIKKFLTDSLAEYSRISRANSKKITNITQKCMTAAIKADKTKSKLEDKRVIFSIDDVSSDDSDVSMASVSSSMSTRSSVGRGRPRSISPQKRLRGRPRSNSSSTSRDRSLIQEQNSYEIRSRGNSELSDLLESIQLLEAGEYTNKKKKYRSYWFILTVKAFEKNVSPRSLIAILELLKEMQPILSTMDIPSESLLTQYKLAIPSLNELQISTFMEAADRFTLAYDETPSNYTKCLGVGLFSEDGNFICIGVQECSGNTGDSLYKVRLSTIQGILII